MRSGILSRGFGALRGLALGFGGSRKGILGTDAAGVIDEVGNGGDALSGRRSGDRFPRNRHGWSCGVSRDVGDRKSHRLIAGPASERSEDLRTIARLAEEGRFRPVFDACFPFEDIVEAYRVVDSGRKKGSVILRLDPHAKLNE